MTLPRRCVCVCIVSDKINSIRSRVRRRVNDFVSKTKQGIVDESECALLRMHGKHDSRVHP